MAASCATSVHPHFCPECGTLLPLWSVQPGVVNVSCLLCGVSLPMDKYEGMTVETSSRPYAFQKREYATTRDELSLGGAAGDATINEKCPKCGHNEMSFHTMQLRSADEGQTIFYTCLKCHYNYSVNS